MIPKIETFVVILLIVLILFGGKKIPELAKSIGQSAKELRKGFSGDDEETKDEAQKKVAKK